MPIRVRLEFVSPPEAHACFSSHSTCPDCYTAHSHHSLSGLHTANFKTPIITHIMATKYLPRNSHTLEKTVLFHAKPPAT